MSTITGFLCSELQHYPFLGFFGHYSVVKIHFLLSISCYSWFPTASTRSYIYIRFSSVTNRRSSTETKLKIMQLNLYLTPTSQATYGPKELQFECKDTHIVKSSLIQIICSESTSCRTLYFHFILSCYDIFVNIRGCYLNT